MTRKEDHRMDYESMTVSQLRELADERGLRLAPKMKKAAIVTSLKESDEGVQSVEAETIEEQNGLAVSLLPGKLHANFAALDERIDGILALYEGWEPKADSAEELKQVSRERKYLNSVAKELDERRKDIKREYLRPLNELEAMFNQRRDRVKAVSARLQDVEKEADEARREARESELREHYEAMAGLLADVVFYDKIADPRWLNKSVSIQTAKQELEERCRKAASDWETLKSLDLAFADEAELRFFETLDLGDATAYARKLAEDKARLEAMKAEREAYMQPAPVIDPVIDPVPVMPVPGLTLESAPVMQPVPFTPQPEHDLPPEQPQGGHEAAEAERGELMRQIMSTLDGYATWQLRNLAEALRVKPGGETRPRVMVMDTATVAQMNAIGKVCGIFGVTGEMKSGTLDEVYRRTRLEAV